MAAVTVVNQKFSVAGNQRIVTGKLTAPANGDTWVTGLTSIDSADVTFSGASAAADSVSVSVSGGTITFNVIGTARDLFVAVSGA